MKKPAKIYITAFPIDRPFLKYIGLWDQEYVKSQSVGRIIKALLAEGYTTIQSSYEPAWNQLSMHFIKEG